MLHRKAKFRALDVVLILAIVGIGVLLFYRVSVNLEYHWNWDKIPRYLIKKNSETGNLETNYLLQGLITTLKLSIWSTLFAVIAGTIMGLFRTSKNLFFRMIGRAYVELIRNLPPLVLVFIFYFFISDQIMPILGVEPFIRSRAPEVQKVLGFFFDEVRLFPQFISAVMTISFFEGAYITEIVRGGIESIERGQREASYALGLKWSDQMRFVIFPQVIRRILPQLAGQFISTIKDSSIVAAISIQELTFQGMQLAVSSHFIFEVWIMVTIMYLTLTLSLSSVVNWIENKLSSKGF